MTRGIQQSRDIWKTFMQAQMFDFRQKPLLKDAQGNFIQNADGTYQRGAEMMTRVQGALRPIELWEYVFPEESLQEVIAMCGQIKSYNQLRPEVAKVAWPLRKLMGAEKIPDMPEFQKKEPWEVTQKYIPMHGLGIYFLGMRKDNKQDYIFDTPQGKIGFYQEGL